jgi:hypothetical protein
VIINRGCKYFAQDIISSQKISSVCCKLWNCPVTCTLQSSGNLKSIQSECNKQYCQKKHCNLIIKKYKEATRSLRDIEEPVLSSDRTIRDKETGLSDQVQVKTGFLPQRREMRCAFNSSYSYLQVFFIHLLILVISMFHTGNTAFYIVFFLIHTYYYFCLLYIRSYTFSKNFFTLQKFPL